MTGTSVEGVTVEGGILQLEASASEFFTAQNTRTADHLEAGVDVFLGFVEILDTLGSFKEDVTHDGNTFWTEVPDLTSFFDVPTELIGEHTSTNLGVLIVGDFEFFDGLENFFGDLGTFEIKSVVLVSRLSHDLTLSWSSNGFTILNDWFRDGEVDGVVAEIFFEILEADFKMEFTDTSNDVLTGFFIHDAENAWIRLF